MKRRLDDIDKINHPFTVEDGYFDDLTQKIQNRVSSRSSATFYLQWKWALAPVLIAIIFAGAYWLNFSNSTPTSSELIAELSTDEILNYLEYAELTEQELLSITPEGTLEDMSDLDEINLSDENLNELMNTFDLNELDI